MPLDYRQQAQRLIFSPGFARAVFSGAQADLRWQRIVIRPVLLRGEQHWQFSYFDATKDFTHNYLPVEAAQKLEEALDFAFRNLTIESGEKRLEVRLSKKGKPLMHTTRITPAGGREPASAAGQAAEAGVQPAPAAHDRVKDKWITAENSAPFLQAVEIMSANGQVRADRQAKLRQINEFVRLVDETGVFDAWPTPPVRIVDFGSGKGYLTFALYHYLSALRGLTAEVTGVDLKADVLEKLNRRAAALEYGGLQFVVGRIDDYAAQPPPDVVVALHACDTATDDALAQGLRWGSRLIVTAPCCHHHLQAQLARLETPPPFEALARHGILFERMGDVLTDALRAAYLRVWGYRAEVIQFISSEHTDRNLMIRAVKTGRPGERRALQAYAALKAYWGVTPYLEQVAPVEEE